MLIRLIWFLLNNIYCRAHYSAAIRQIAIQGKGVIVLLMPTELLRYNVEEPLPFKATKSQGMIERQEYAPVITSVFNLTVQIKKLLN